MRILADERCLAGSLLKRKNEFEKLRVEKAAEREEWSREVRSGVSSQLSVAYQEVPVIHGHDRKSLVQTKAQGRT